MAERESVTPSGFRILFEDGEPDPETGKSRRRSYTVNDEKLPSVTSVLGILDKAGLKFAAERLAVEGMIELAREGEMPLHPDGALSAMKGRGLRFWQVWERKADRGTLAHEDLVALASGQEPAKLEVIRPEERGFMRGVAAWYADYRPTLVHQEFAVASLEYGYAGRPDLLADFKRPDISGRGLIDLKSVQELPRYKDGQIKPPYDENVIQTEAYETASRESGYPGSDFRAVVRVDGTGEYDMTLSWAEQDCFLPILRAYQALKELGKAKPKYRKAAA